MSRRTVSTFHIPSSDAFPARRTAEDIEASGRRAQAANGFGDASVEPTPPVPRPTRVPRGARIAGVATVAVATLGKAGAALRARWHGWRAEAMAVAIDELDAAALRDLGIERSELTSIAFEAAHLAERTRRRLAF